MRQPEPPDPIEDLREWLQFAVPLRIRELEWDIRCGDMAAAARALRDETVVTRRLRGMAVRAGISLGTHGDPLMFTSGRERQGRARTRVARSAADLAAGIAAAAVLAGDDGVEVLGLQFRPSGPAPDPAPSPEPPPPRRPVTTVPTHGRT